MTIAAGQDWLTRTIIQMAGAAEAQVERATQAVLRRDAEAALQAMQADRRIDSWEREIEATAIALLDEHRPGEAHLREILSAVKIASDLERIGDYAANSAKRAIALAQAPAVRPAAGIQRMGRLVQGILKEVVDAYVERDVAAAIQGWKRDEELDDLYTSLFREVLTYMMEDPRTITPCTHLLFIAKNMERIGDHATNIAETIHFLVTGQPIGTARPKGDTSSFTGLDGDDPIWPLARAFSRGSTGE